MSLLANINSQIPIEMLIYIFDNFQTPEENGKNSSVCTLWKDVVKRIVKDQLIERYVLSIQLKSAPFSLMVGGKKVEDFSPQYKQALEALRDNKETLTSKEVYTGLNNLTEKHFVCLAGFFLINPQSIHMPKDREESISGKAFGEFHEIDEHKNFQLWGEVAGHLVTYLPIKLFNWNLLENGTVSGNKDKGEICFSLKGKVIELILVPGSKEAQDGRWGGFSMDRNGAPMTETYHLVPETARTGHIWPSDLYVPKLDAAAVPKEEKL